MVRTITDSVTDPATCPIQPRQIDSGQHLFDSFATPKQAEAARYVLRMSQKLGGWFPFSIGQIDALWQGAGNRHVFSFQGLVCSGLLVFRGGKYYVTYLFVACYFEESPAL